MLGALAHEKRLIIEGHRSAGCLAGPQCFLQGRQPRLLRFEQPQTGPNHIAGRTVTARYDLGVYELGQVIPLRDR